jgi:hypothetical protein
MKGSDHTNRNLSRVGVGGVGGGGVRLRLGVKVRMRVQVRGWVRVRVRDRVRVRAGAFHPFSYRRWCRGRIVLNHLVGVSKSDSLTFRVHF